MKAVVAQSVSYAKISNNLLSSCSTSTSPFLQCKSSLLTYQSAKILGLKGLNLQCIRIIKPLTEKKRVVELFMLLKMKLHQLIMLLRSEMVVGRAAEKADLVIPVATVSGLHARIQNKEGSLLITDLDSTNGTYINEKRVPPGVTEVVPAGSLLTFGDTNLAIFRVSKIEKTIDNEAENSEEKGTEVAAQPETTS
ncbi:Zeaxanthin epoxidase chloroplastic [Bienertia sinuspersici]